MGASLFWLPFQQVLFLWLVCKTKEIRLFSFLFLFADKLHYSILLLTSGQQGLPYLLGCSCFSLFVCFCCCFWTLSYEHLPDSLMFLFLFSNFSNHLWSRLTSIRRYRPEVLTELEGNWLSNPKAHLDAHLGINVTWPQSTTRIRLKVMWRQGPWLRSHFVAEFVVKQTWNVGVQWYCHVKSSKQGCQISVTHCVQGSVLVPLKTQKDVPINLGNFWPSHCKVLGQNSLPC